MKNSDPKKNLLIVSASELDANQYYASRFLAPDPFIFIQIKNRKYLLMSDLEVDRAKKQSSADEVISTSVLAKAYLKKHAVKPSYADLIRFFSEQKKVNGFTVPADFPLGLAEHLRKKKITLEIKPDPFFESRTIKTAEEVRAITRAIRHVEAAVETAIGILRQSVIRRGKLYWKGSLLKSETLRKIVHLQLMENNCVGTHSIIACGEQSVDPHNEGNGPLYAHQSIIMDIFPRDISSRYHADFTRTVVRGRPSKKLQAMYDAVKEGQEIGFRMIRHGIDGSAVHQAIQKSFDEKGFKTGLLNGRMQGFFHSTGHGLGLDIHEAPSVSVRKDILKTGQVVTVEPGLYYQGIGGVRLEDVVVVTENGCRNLTRYPKFLAV